MKNHPKGYKDHWGAIIKMQDEEDKIKVNKLSFVIFTKIFYLLFIFDLFSCHMFQEKKEREVAKDKQNKYRIDLENQIKSLNQQSAHKHKNNHFENQVYK